MRLAGLLCYAFAAALALYFWSPLLDAKWGLIDDHEVIGFVGTADRLPLSRVPAILADTELTPNSTLPRFRPSYYGLRILEAVAWGKNATLWYAARIAIAVLVALALAHVCLQAAGPILTMGFLPFALSSPYWGDVFARAGVGETYCALGLALIAFALGGQPRETLSTGRVAVIALGIVIAAGAKENFLLLGAVPLWFLVAAKPRVSLAGKAISLGVLIYLAWIAVTVFLRVRSAGTDIYANDASIAFRLRLLLSFLSLQVVHFWLAALAIALIVSWRVSAVGKPLRGYFWAGGVLLAIYASQFVFYAGQWPYVPNRFQFPGVLAYHGAVLLGFAGLVAAAMAWKMPDRAVMALQIAAAAALLYWSIGDFGLNRAQAYKTVETTVAFDRNLNVVRAELAKDPSRPLVINSHYFNDYEPIFSIERFLRAASIGNAIALRLAYTPGLGDTREEALGRTLAELSRDGQKGLFVPLSGIDLARCYSVGMSGPFLASCDGGGLVIYP
jgi:hypothetical protein